MNVKEITTNLPTALTCSFNDQRGLKSRTLCVYRKKKIEANYMV